MAPAGPKTQAARKRTRKRKRRDVSSSSESSSSEGSSSESDTPQQTAVVRVAAKTAKSQPKPAPPSESSSSSSSSDSESESDAGPEARSPHAAPNVTSSKPARRSPSPTPPPTAVPSFLPEKGASEQEEQVLKDRFRKFWMASVADAFKDDLEEIRKQEPNLPTSRLAMLIDSLAAGGDVFTSSRVEPDSGMTEMEMVLEHNT